MIKELKNQKLKELHAWLIEKNIGYVALCEAGSTTAGDPGVNNRTDRDITIVVQEFSDQLSEEIGHYLKGRFDDTYLFIMFDIDTFLTTQSEQDLSVKFRGQTLFGEDVIAKKEKPSQEFAADIVDKGLKSLSRKLRTRLMNAEHWSIEQLRNYMYPEFKRLVMFLATKKYAETGKYPKSRTEVVQVYGSKELKKVVDAIHNIDSLDNEDIMNVAAVAIDLCDSEKFRKGE